MKSFDPYDPTYLAIVEWLDQQEGQGVGHSNGHGSPTMYLQSNYTETLNFGIFSIVDDLKHCSHILDESKHDECVSYQNVSLEEWDRLTAMEELVTEIEWHRQYENWR